MNLMIKDPVRLFLSQQLLVQSFHKLKAINLPQSGENGNLDLPLPGVAGMVLQNLDGDDLIGSLLPALGHLSECSPTEELEDLVLVVDGGVEDLMLDQLVVPITVGAPGPPSLPSPARLAD